MNESANYLAQNRKLFEVAVKEFAEKTYHYASLNDIVKKADFNKGSFYYRFTDKRMLYYAVLDLVNIEHIEIFNGLLLRLVNKNDFVALSLVLFQSIQELEKMNPDYAQILRMHTLYNLPHVDPVPQDCTTFVYHRYVEYIRNVEHKQNVQIVEMLYFSNFISSFSLEELKNFLVVKDPNQAIHVPSSFWGHVNLSADQLIHSLPHSHRNVLIMAKSQSGKTTLANELFKVGSNHFPSIVLLDSQFRLSKKQRRRNAHYPETFGTSKQVSFPIQFTCPKKQFAIIKRVIKSQPSLVIIDDSFSKLSQSLSTVIFDCLLKYLPKTCKIVLIATTLPLPIPSTFEIMIFNHYQLKPLAPDFQDQSIENTVLICYRKDGLDFMEIHTKDFLKTDIFLEKLKHIDLHSISPVLESPQLIYQHKTGDVLK